MSERAAPERAWPHGDRSPDPPQDACPGHAPAEAAITANLPPTPARLFANVQDLQNKSARPDGVVASDRRDRVERPRVLFIEGSTGFGGSGAILLSTMQHLDRRRFDVRMSTYLAANNRHVNAIRDLGIPYVPLSQRRCTFAPFSLPMVTHCRNRYLRRLLLIAAWLYKAVVIDAPLVLRLARLLKSEKISVVVFNNDLHYHVIGVVASRIAGVPCIVRKAGGIGEGKWIKRFLTDWVDVFAPISNATNVDQLRHRATKRTVLIPGAVDLTRFDAGADRTDARVRLGLPTSGKIVGSASRLEEGKGQKELVQAAAKVVREFPDVLFYIAGSSDPADTDSHVLEDLQDLARKFGIAEKVVFGGWQDDIPCVMAALDIFVHCPTTVIEGLCIANLEAMASGKPTVVSENGGLPDAVVDGVTGFIVPPGDVDALAERIVMLLRDPRLARQFGENARKRVEHHFEISAMMRAYERLLAECVKPLRG